MAAPTNNMTALEIARKLAELGQTADACRAYELVIRDDDHTTAEEKLEASIFTLQFGEDYKVSYDGFLKLYRQDKFSSDILPIMLDAFYAPNESDLKKRYEQNCRLLKKYSYCFREDFLPFEDLPILFFPYDNNGYIPFDIERGTFGEYTDFNRQIISRNFFKDLDKPILADNVFSQYELEYLRDNVRRSDWVARDNHIYLHYTDWSVFCAHLQCLDLREILKEEKIVFLFEDEISRYPLDFKAEYGIDYASFPVKPIGVREVNRLIFHAQLSAHNGGDFFNEIFYGHPNLILWESIMIYMLEDMVEMIKDGVKTLKKHGTGWAGLTISNGTFNAFASAELPAFQQLLTLKNMTDKDALVAAFFAFSATQNQEPDPACRIVPTLFIQPHFHNMIYLIDRHPNNCAILECKEFDQLINTKMLKGFKYVKSFVPIRRITTSYTASVRFALRFSKIEEAKAEKKDKPVRFHDFIRQRVLTRTYLADTNLQLFKDCVMVRFEDAKLNPKATFTELAAFLDLPYTESMTQCTNYMGEVPNGFRTNVVNFKYSAFTTDSECYYLEYLMRDAYEAYGYDFHFYDGKPVDEARLKELIAGFEKVNDFTMRHRNHDGTNFLEQFGMSPEDQEKFVEESKPIIEEYDKIRLMLGNVIGPLPTFVNKNGEPLKMIPLLRPNPDLLENELYH